MSFLHTFSQFYALILRSKERVCYLYAVKLYTLLLALLLLIILFLVQGHHLVSQILLARMNWVNLFNMYFIAHKCLSAQHLYFGSNFCAFHHQIVNRTIPVEALCYFGVLVKDFWCEFSCYLDCYAVASLYLSEKESILIMAPSCRPATLTKLLRLQLLVSNKLLVFGFQTACLRSSFLYSSFCPGWTYGSQQWIIQIMAFNSVDNIKISLTIDSIWQFLLLNHVASE